MTKKEIATLLTSIKNKMEIEKLVLPSLQHEELNDEVINKFVETMTNAYNSNINMIKQIIEKLEKRSSKKDGK